MKNTDNKLTYAGGYVDITPLSPLHLAGYGRRGRVFGSVADQLEVNVIVLRHSEHRLIFVQLDVLSVGTKIRSRILDRLCGRIHEEDLVLVASHTHFAPNIDCRLPDMGVIDNTYVDSVAERTASLIEKVLAVDYHPARLRYGEGQAAHSVNRRAWCWSPARGFPPIKRVMARHPNLAGEKDETVRLFVVSSEPPVSIPLGVFWNYACHPVGFYDYNAVSADYPGAVRRYLRSRLGADVPVIFLPGFAGNIRPQKIDPLPKSAYYMAHRLVNGPVWGRFNAESWNAWTTSLAEVVFAATEDESQLWEVPCFGTYRFSQPLEELMDGKVDDRNLTYHLVRLSRRCVMIVLSAEPVVEYVASLREMLLCQTVIPIGYSDGVCGYLPTTEMLDEGGLEVTSPGYSLGHARFRRTISESVLLTIRDCFEKLVCECGGH